MAGKPRAADAVAIGIDFLERFARQPDGGYALRFDLQGKPIDETRGLYDHAFVLFAFASASRIGARDELRAKALDLMGYIDTRLAHPREGYLESLPPALPRRQNPHMHLLEACLAAAKNFGDEIFLETARRIITLFADRFFQPCTATLGEFFDDDLKVIEEGGKHVAEPGHHCEWIWLISRWKSLDNGPLSPEPSSAADALMEFVDRNGVNPGTGTLFNEVWSDGSVRNNGSRLWAQTERIKAELLRVQPSRERSGRAYAALARHIMHAPEGLWREHLHDDGSWTPEAAPATSLYHLTCGILESRDAMARLGW